MWDSMSVYDAAGELVVVTSTTSRSNVTWPFDNLPVEWLGIDRLRLPRQPFKQLQPLHPGSATYGSFN
jgi:hypothetical protein